MGDMDTLSQVQGEGVTTLPRRPREETARLGDAIYERDIRPHVEADHHGEFVSIDVASGGWAISDDLLTAVKRLREQCPDAIDVWSVQVGYGVIGSIGGGSHRFLTLPPALVAELNLPFLTNGRVTPPNPGENTARRQGGGGNLGGIAGQGAPRIA